LPSHDAGDPRRFFDAIAGRYDRAYGLDRDASRARMARVVSELAPRSRVLDLGVGTGRELGALQDEGHDVVGLDFSPAMLAICARRARPVPLVLADLWSALPFDAGSFDAALALHGTLAHPPSGGALQSLVGELARVLAPGGVVIAEVPSPGWLDALDADRARPAAADGRRFAARRTGPRDFVHEDLAAGVSIGARVIDAPQWAEAFAPHFAVRVEPISDVEQLVACRRIG